MNTKLAKRVRKEFHDQFVGKFPFFEVSKDAVVPPGWVVYGYHKPGISFFIVLAIFRQDQFTLEVAWARKPSFPADIPRGGRDGERLIERSSTRYLLAGQVFRLADFMPDQRTDKIWDFENGNALDRLLSGTNEWLEVNEVEQARLVVAVSDAVDHIGKFIVPFFESAAADLQCSYSQSDR